MTGNYAIIGEAQRRLPDEATIAAIRERYPVEPEIDAVLTRKMHRRHGPGYVPATLERLVEGIGALVTARVGYPVEVADARWLGGGASKLQVLFDLKWHGPDGKEPRTDTLVLLGCRSSEHGAAAAATLVAREPSWAARLETLQVDVNDAAQVQSAAADVRARHGEACLYGLVNNAGIAGGTPAEIVDTNLRGVKRVSDAFASLVAPSGRVVNVSSGSAPMFVAECAPERVRFFRDASTTWAALDAAANEYVAACAAGEEALAALGYPRKANACARPRVAAFLARCACRLGAD